MKLKYKKSKKGEWKKAVAVGAAALAVSGAFWWLGTPTGKNYFRVPAYRALRVIDGDTFETTERQLIRLTGIDAPDLELCDGREAKQYLEKLIMNKNLYIKVVFRDGLNRLISHVYNDKGLVAEQMLEAGMAFNTGNGIDDPSLQKTGDLARERKIGIYSSKCTQDINPDNSKCLVKANVRGGKGEKLYRFPGCGQYNTTLVQLYLGDRWFCTEEQSQKAGFTKGSDCFDKTWR